MPLCVADDGALAAFWEEDAAVCEPPPPQAATNEATAASTAAATGRPARRRRAVARFLPPAGDRAVLVMSLSFCSQARVLGELYETTGNKPLTLLPVCYRPPATLCTQAKCAGGAA